ncbi:MAG: molybdopterin-dependent oxidoreductase [Brucellaceae bacterium]|nr:molybdopterin-dependent oxidoreductase [Brucellaceae bacterium]
MINSPRAGVVAACALAAAIQILGCSGTYAAEKLFSLVKADGSTVDVTDEDFEAVGIAEITTRLVGETETRSQVRGPRFDALLDHFGVDGEMVRVSGIDKYAADLPLDELKRYPVLLAYEINGKRLTLRSKGPVWVVYPFDDHPEIEDQLREARSVWQVGEVEVLQ